MIADDGLANTCALLYSRTMIADDGLAKTCILYTAGQ